MSSSNQQQSTTGLTTNNDNFNYKLLFQEILSKSITTNCLCYYLKPKSSKTKIFSRRRDFQSTTSKCLFDNYGAFLDDDDEDEDENEIFNNNNNSTSQNTDKNTDSDDTDYNQCDTSCYDKMQKIYSTLSSCFKIDTIASSSSSSSSSSTDTSISIEEQEQFNNYWSKCILSKYPNSIDNYGSTIYHYATNKNNLKLLICLINQYKQSIYLTDSKGMTILTRSCQKNYLNISSYLLKNTNSDPNGSKKCIYTPLLISITNGYYSQAKLLLESNACPSLIKPDNDSEQRNDQINLVLSPVRSAIIYEKFQILNLLLKYGANTNELIVNDTLLLNAKLSDYLNCLKLLFRHLNEVNFKYMIELNDFIENINVYRMMAISFLNSCNYDDLFFNEFLSNLGSFDTLNLTFTQTLLCEYLIKLIKMFYKPKTLKELCRFRIRNFIIFYKNRDFQLINRISYVPKSLKIYLLHENYADS